MKTNFFHLYIIMNIIVRCSDLPETNNRDITYTPLCVVSATLPAGQRYTGTIATYSCSPGYQLVGGSSLRACGPDGIWNGTEPSCGKLLLTVCMYSTLPATALYEFTKSKQSIL